MQDPYNIARHGSRVNRNGQDYQNCCRIIVPSHESKSNKSCSWSNLADVVGKFSGVCHRQMARYDQPVRYSGIPQCNNWCKGKWQSTDDANLFLLNSEIVKNWDKLCQSQSYCLCWKSMNFVQIHWKSIIEVWVSHDVPKDSNNLEKRQLLWKL